MDETLIIDSDPSDLTGQTLSNRYAVSARLGHGGMATVYTADDLTLKRQVVVKVPHARLLLQPGFRERFTRELTNLTRLKHPHIMHIQDLGEHEEIPYAVVDYLAGGDLSDRIAKAGGQLTPKEIAQWLPDIASALDFTTSKKVVHRDVKPDNILFDEQGHVFLSDFGIATVMQREEDETIVEDTGQLTVDGGFVGSPNYAPPEALLRDLAAGYDQYSLGVTVYQALSGALPVKRETSEATLAAKAHEDATPLSKFVKGIPKPIEAAVMKTLARKPQERFDSCADFARAFCTAVEQSAGGSGGGMRSASIAAVVLLVVGGGWFAWTQFGTGSTATTTSAIDSQPSSPAVVAIADEIVREPEDAFESEPEAVEEIIPSGEDPTLDDEEAPGGSNALPASPASAASSAPFAFTYGSTPEEIDFAIELCEEYLGACKAAAATNEEASQARLANCEETFNGCKREGYADEATRTADIGLFEMDLNEITNAQFNDFIETHPAHETTAEIEGHSYLFGTLRADGVTWRNPGGGERKAEPATPVVHVGLRDAEAYCEAVGGRLPTEAEWEYTARGNDGRVFPWGNEWLANNANWSDSDDVRLAASGSHPSGETPEAKVADLAGSVWEWTSTRFDSDDGEVLYVLKGGSWASRNPTDLRAATRLLEADAATTDDIGFRCVRNL